MPFQETRESAPLRLLLLTLILFAAYLCVAAPLPIIPVFATRTLGLGNAWAGLAVGIAFLSTIATRGLAGRMADQRGAKPTVLRGFAFYALGAALSVVAGTSLRSPWSALAILLAGRLVLGLGESFVGVGTIAWGVGIVGPARAGRVLALIGAAIYGALAVGGPLGLVLLERFGFAGAMAVSAVLPCLGILAIWKIPPIEPLAQTARPPFSRVIGRIWLHGSVVCLQGIGFAAIGAFFVLHFLRQGWAHAGLGLTAFGCGFVLVRILLGDLPDRFGGIPVAIGSLVVEAIGQAIIWSAPGPNLAFLGAFLTGVGCSLVFPSMGREVVQQVEPALRGTALGGYAAFQDLAYGITGPLVGLVADRAGYRGVYLVGACAAISALGVAVLLRRAGWRSATPPEVTR